jgi:cell division protease FtsH
LFFGEDGTTNGAYNDITRVTQLLHHAVGEMGMYRKTRLNFGALSDGQGGGRALDDETRNIMEAQSQRLYAETKALLQRLMPLSEHLVGRLMQSIEMDLAEALDEIRRFEAERARTAGAP